MKNFICFIFKLSLILAFVSITFSFLSKLFYQPSEYISLYDDDAKNM